MCKFEDVTSSRKAASKSSVKVDVSVQATAPIFRSDGVHCNSFNVISPLPFGLSPIAQIYVIFLLKQTSFARGELGARIIGAVL